MDTYKPATPVRLQYEAGNHLQRAEALLDDVINYRVGLDDVINYRVGDDRAIIDAIKATVRNLSRAVVLLEEALAAEEAGA